MIQTESLMLVLAFPRAVGWFSGLWVSVVGEPWFVWWQDLWRNSVGPHTGVWLSLEVLFSKICFQKNAQVQEMTNLWCSTLSPILFCKIEKGGFSPQAPGIHVNDSQCCRRAPLNPLLCRAQSKNQGWHETSLKDFGWLKIRRTRWDLEDWGTQSFYWWFH